MSGEAFNGQNFLLREIAEIIDEYINPDNIKYDEHKDWTKSELTKDAIIELSKIRDDLNRLNDLTYYAAMLLSGDYSSETFLEKINKNQVKINQFNIKWESVKEFDNDRCILIVNTGKVSNIDKDIDLYGFEIYHYDDKFKIDPILNSDQFGIGQPKEGSIFDSVLECQNWANSYTKELINKKG